jgi:hypothetical protein
MKDIFSALIEKWINIPLLGGARGGLYMYLINPPLNLLPRGDLKL